MITLLKRIQRVDVYLGLRHMNLEVIWTDGKIYSKEKLYSLNGCLRLLAGQWTPGNCQLFKEKVLDVAESCLCKTSCLVDQKDAVLKISLRLLWPQDDSNAKDGPTGEEPEKRERLIYFGALIYVYKCLSVSAGVIAVDNKGWDLSSW